MLTNDTKVIKLSTRFKDHVSTRIDENGVKTKKLWLKQCSRDLFVRVLNLQGLALKKPGT